MLIPLNLVANATTIASVLIPPVVLASADADGLKCETLGQCRTIGNIISSCLVTIFACIWVSIHPNMPRPQPTFVGLGASPKISEQLADFWHRRFPSIRTAFLDKLAVAAVALLALLAPEFIFAWAFRQRLRASRLAKQCREAAMKPKAIKGRKRRGVLEAEFIRRSSDLSDDESETGDTDSGAGDIAAEAGQADMDTESVPLIAMNPPASDEDDADDVNESSSMSTTKRDDAEEDMDGEVVTTSRTVPSPADPSLVHDQGTDESGSDKTNWTVTHGFFIIMGGFHQFHGDTPGVFLRPDDVVRLISKGQLIPPSEEEILDRSKTDSFSKMLVLVQTLWFVMQCIARHLEHLPITELEIATLAFTTIIVGVYICWWNKPLGIVQPVRVPSYIWNPPSEGKGPTKSDYDGFDITFNALDGTDEGITNLPKVPRYYSGGCTGDQVAISWVIAFFVTSFFGAIHCFAWSFHFASIPERIIWRVTSLIITALPLSFFLEIILFGMMSDFLPKNHPRLSATWWGLRVCICVLVTSFLSYFVARTALIVIAFTSLRSLPYGACEIVNWTTYFPHI